jgi:hypothetical protein
MAGEITPDSRARWCAGHNVEAAEGVFRVWADEPTPRIGATMHRTP